MQKDTKSGSVLEQVKRSVSRKTADRVGIGQEKQQEKALHRGSTRIKEETPEMNHQQG